MRYSIMVEEKIAGPYSVEELIAMPGLNRSSSACPEFEMVEWRPIREFPELDYFFRLRAAAERLYARESETRERLLAQIKKGHAVETELKAVREELQTLKSRAEYANAMALSALQIELAHAVEELIDGRRKVQESALAVESLKRSLDTANAAALEAHKARLAAEEELARLKGF